MCHLHCFVGGTEKPHEPQTAFTQLEKLYISDFEDGSSCRAGASGGASRRGSLLHSLPRNHRPSWCELPFENRAEPNPRFRTDIIDKLLILKINTAVKTNFFSCRPVFGHWKSFVVNIVVPRQPGTAGTCEKAWHIQLQHFLPHPTRTHSNLICDEDFFNSFGFGKIRFSARQNWNLWESLWFLLYFRKKNRCFGKHLRVLP